MTISKPFFFTLIIIEFLLLFVIATAWIGYSWKIETFYQNCQPQQLNYKSNGPYCVTVLKRIGTLKDKYEIAVTAGDQLDYGYLINYPESDLFDEESLRTKTQVIWDSTGVFINCYSGNKIFVPKERFVGGR